MFFNSFYVKGYVNKKQKNAMKKSIVILSCLLSLGAISLSAQSKEHPSSKEMLTKMDTNKDGKISKVEAKGHLGENFDSMDSNKDGFLTETELSAIKGHRAEMDMDNDGKISKAEAKGPLLKDFDSIDTNKDGFLSKEEMKAHHTEKIEAMDTNKDGKISKAEATGHVSKNFDSADTNKDGFLSKEEMKNCKESCDKNKAK